MVIFWYHDLDMIILSYINWANLLHWPQSWMSVQRVNKNRVWSYWYEHINMNILIWSKLLKTCWPVLSLESIVRELTTLRDDHIKSLLLLLWDDVALSAALSEPSTMSMSYHINMIFLLVKSLKGQGGRLDKL